MADNAVSTGPVPVPDRGPAVFDVTVATLVVGTLFLLARLYCRAFIVRRLGWDDYFIMLAWIFAAGLSMTIFVGTRHGLGRYDTDISAEDRLPLRKSEFVFSVLYNPALMALKTSVLVFYLRLSRNTQQVLRICSWVVLAIVNVAGLVLTLVNVFQCRPVMAAFSVYSGQGQCIPLLTEFICSAPVDVVTDLAMLALPIPVLTGMRLPKRQKCILVFTFSLGVFVTILDVVRLHYLQQAISSAPTTSPSSDPATIFDHSPDFARNASLSLMWSAVEVNIGMMLTCIPTLKPLIIKILPAAIMDPDGTASSHTGEHSGFPTSHLSTHASGSEKDRGRITQNDAEPPTCLRPPQDTLIAPAPAQFDSSEEPKDLVEFPTSPNAISIRAAAQEGRDWPRSKKTWSRGTKRESALYFGFVNMERPKSMVETSLSESLQYCAMVTVLFLLWGFSYGLLNMLNNVIASIAHMTLAETIGLTSVYFGGGYFFGPLIVGGWLLRRDEHTRFHDQQHRHRDLVGGFRATFMLGLCIYGVGAIMFWPSAILTSFPGFIISNFVAGFGLGVLETAANPFIILCGPRQYAETRILIAQGFQGVATVLSGVLAKMVFFVNLGSDGHRETADQLLDVQWTYVAITLSCAALALFLYYMPLPEVSDAELGHAAEDLPVDPKKRSLGGLQLRTVLIILAMLAQWTYVAAQESMSIFFRELITTFVPASGSPSSPAAAAATFSSSASSRPYGLSLSVTDYVVTAHGAFTLSRFGAAHLAYLGARHPRARLIPSPRTLLGLCTALALACAVLCAVLQPPGGGSADPVAVLAVLFYFAEGPLWPLIFALGLRGQGDCTKRAAVWLTMGASGPAVWPFVMYAIRAGPAGRASSSGARRRLQLAFVVVVVLLLFTLAYPLFLAAVRDARAVVDAGGGHGREEEEEEEGGVFVSGGGGGGGGNASSGLPWPTTTMSRTPRDDNQSLIGPGGAAALVAGSECRA